MRWTKKLVKKQFMWTNHCYKLALLDFYGDKIPKERHNDSANNLQKFIVFDLGFSTRRDNDKITELYYSHIKKLSTEKIILIIEAYNLGKQGRSPLTIDVLTTELLERTINF